MEPKVDYKAFQTKLNAHCPEQPYTEPEAIEAFHNLVGFVRALMKAEQEICGSRNIPVRQALKSKD